LQLNYCKRKLIKNLLGFGSASPPHTYN